MKSSHTLFYVASCLTALVSCGWMTPPPNTGRMDYGNNNVYLVGSTIRLEWNVTLPSYSLWLWQQNLTVAAAGHQGAVYVKDASATETGGITWTVTTQRFNLSASNVFFLYLGVNETLQGNGRGFVSHYLNLTTDPSLVRTSPATLQSPSQSPSSSPTSGSNSTTQTTSQPNESSDATKIGLGVGLGVGIPFLLILSAVLFMTIRKNYRKNELSDLAAEKLPEPSELSAQPLVPTSATDKFELPARGAELVELPSNQRN